MSRKRHSMPPTDARGNSEYSMRGRSHCFRKVCPNPFCVRCASCCRHSHNHEPELKTPSMPTTLAILIKMGGAISSFTKSSGGRRNSEICTQVVVNVVVSFRLCGPLLCLHRVDRVISTRADQPKDVQFSM